MLVEGCCEVGARLKRRVEGVKEVERGMQCIGVVGAGVDD